MAALLLSHGRPGFYFRVLEKGDVGAGDEIIKVKAGPAQVTVAEINGLLYLPGHPSSGLERALRIPALSAGWRTSLEALLGRERKSSGTTGNPGLGPPIGPRGRLPQASNSGDTGQITVRESRTSRQILGRYSIP
jgi:3-alpha domain